MAGRRWTKQEEQTLIEMNADGYSYREISNALGRSLASCQQRGRNVLGLSGDQNVNEKFFEQDNQVTNYVLGYWMADGYITYKSGGWYFGLTSIDSEHLENIAELMEFKGNINVRKDGKTHDLVIGNKTLVNNMIKLGCRYNKTHNMSIQDLSINPKYFYDFIRGFFDGDGSYSFQTYVKRDGTRSISSLKFTGTKKMLTSVQDMLGYGTLIPDTRKGDCGYLMFFGNEMRELLDLMYKNSEIALERKEEIYRKHNLLRMA